MRNLRSRHLQIQEGEGDCRAGLGYAAANHNIFIIKAFSYQSMDDKDLSRFIFEIGALRRVRSEGWMLVGMKSPHSVAEHSLRAAQIGFVLAKLEDHEDPYKVCSMLAFHDIGECRVGDIHKLANRYISVDERRAVKEQTGKIGDIGKDIFSMWDEVEGKSTKAGIIAKDADLLEHAFSAKELIEIGYTHADDWIQNIGKILKTGSAKRLHESLKQSCSYDWWNGLKKLD